MTTVAEIKSVMNASQGPSQPCHYVVNIVPNVKFLSGISAIGAADPVTQAVFPVINLLSMKRLSLLAESASLPSRNISSTPHRIFGTAREMPYGVDYQSMFITFICTNLMIERTFFDLWHQFIISPKSCYMGYYDDYVANIVITKVDNSDSIGSTVGETLSNFILEEAYPKSIQAQDISYSSTDEYLKLTVEFSYARFRTFPLGFLDWGAILEIGPKIVGPQIGFF